MNTNVVSKFKTGDLVVLKDEAIPYISDQMQEDISHLKGVKGRITQGIGGWDWTFVTYGGSRGRESFGVLEIEVEAVKA